MLKIQLVFITIFVLLISSCSNSPENSFLGYWAIEEFNKHKPFITIKKEGGRLAVRVYNGAWRATTFKNGILKYKIDENTYELTYDDKSKKLYFWVNGVNIRKLVRVVPPNVKN